MTTHVNPSKSLAIYFADSLSLEEAVGARAFSHVRELLESYGNITSPQHSLPTYFSTEPYEREIQLLQIADCLVVDATLENTAIGWKIGMMQHLGKPILYLYHLEIHKRPHPSLCCNPNISVHAYSPSKNLESIIDSFFSMHFQISRLVLV